MVSGLNQGVEDILRQGCSQQDEKNAIWATLLFNVAHYALRHGLGF